MKKIYIWSFIVILLIGFIIMSLILSMIVLKIGNMTIDFIRFVESLLEEIELR